MNEPELGAGIDPGMAFNPFSSSIWIRRDSNPQPLDCESSSLTTRPDLLPGSLTFTLANRRLQNYKQSCAIVRDIQRQTKTRIALPLKFN